MANKRFSKYFWHNMRLFTSVFYVICTVATLVFLYIMSSNQLEKIEIRYQNTAKNCSVEIDAKLKEIRKLINDISLITWVKKLSSSSEVFLREFDDLQRLECQAELTRYFATDGAISDIALYMADRGAVLSQRGWFTESEYKACMKGKCDLDLDAVLEAARVKGNIMAFGEEAYNTGTQNLALISNLINVEEPPASLILILNREAFNQSLAKLGGETVLGIEVLNLSGEAVFSNSREIPEGWTEEIDSGVFPLRYRITCQDPSKLLGESHGLTWTFMAVMLLMLALAALLSFLLSLHNIRPLQNLVGKIGKVAGDGFENRGGGVTEFEQIENFVQTLYLQKKSLQESLQENSKQAKQYALLLILSGDEKFVQGGLSWFETLEIPFTEEMAYFVWLIQPEAETGEPVSVLDLFLELQPLMDAAEEVRIGSGQLALIIGYDPGERTPDLEETVELVRLLTMERTNVLLQIETEKTDTPGIAGISHAWYRMVQRLQQRDGAEEDLRGRELVAYIDAHFCDPELSLKDLGQRWGLSVSTVSRLCKEAMGVSFLAYLTSLRLEKAKELLACSEMTPAQVAEAVGYTSEYSFRRAFSRNENCRLQDWIAENRKE